MNYKNTRFEGTFDVANVYAYYIQEILNAEVRNEISNSQNAYRKCEFPKLTKP